MPAKWSCTGVKKCGIAGIRHVAAGPGPGVMGRVLSVGDEA